MNRRFSSKFIRITPCITTSCELSKMYQKSNLVWSDLDPFEELDIEDDDIFTNDELLSNVNELKRIEIQNNFSDDSDENFFKYISEHLFENTSEDSTPPKTSDINSDLIPDITPIYTETSPEMALFHHKKHIKEDDKALDLSLASSSASTSASTSDSISDSNSAFTSALSSVTTSASTSATTSIWTTSSASSWTPTLASPSAQTSSDTSSKRALNAMNAKQMPSSSAAVPMAPFRRPRGRPPIMDPMLKARNKQKSQIKAAKRYRQKQKEESIDFNEVLLKQQKRNDELREQFIGQVQELPAMVEKALKLSDLSGRERARVEKIPKLLYKIKFCPEITRIIPFEKTEEEKLAEKKVRKYVKRSDKKNDKRSDKKDDKRSVKKNGKRSDKKEDKK